MLSCAENKDAEKVIKEEVHISLPIKNTSLIILGTIQDAGSPQIACNKSCCINLFKNPDPSRKIISLGLVDPQNNKSYLFEATPDMGAQIELLNSYKPKRDSKIVDGIFLTHAHIGHYTGLMFLGKEAMNAKNITVYAMPKMKDFLSTNGPWDQLVANKNVLLHDLENEKAVQLSKSITVTPILVPHRDEYSETVGYRIKGPNKSALFIPDIDKWEKWDKDIIAEIKQVDYAFLDATFYSGTELGNRDMSAIPHPFIMESLKKFKMLPKEEKSKIIFIHFNHSNPVLDPNSKEYQFVIDQGFNIGKIEAVFEL